jgi:hypothetical protein
MKYLGLVVVTVAACAPVEHVAVTPVPPNPTPQQRMWFWDTFRPEGNVEEVITVCRSTGGCTTTRNTVIRFTDRRVVRDPIDLAPLVDPASRTRLDAESAIQSRHHARLWAVATVAGVIAGLALGVDGHNSDNTTELGIGIGIGAGSLLAGAIGSNIAAHNAREASASAFAWYPHDLAEHLHVCFNGVTVMPCEANTPGTPPPPPAPDPNLDQLRQR